MMRIIAMRCVHYWGRGETNDREKKERKCKYRSTLLSQTDTRKKNNGILKFYKRFGSSLGEVQTYNNTTAARRLILFVSHTTCKCMMWTAFKLS